MSRKRKRSEGKRKCHGGRKAIRKVTAWNRMDDDVKGKGKERMRKRREERARDGRNQSYMCNDRRKNVGQNGRG